MELYHPSDSARAEDFGMVRNRTELGDLFPIRGRQMGNKGAQAKANNLVGNQNRNVEKAKIKSRQTKSFPVRSFILQEKESVLQKDMFRDTPTFNGIVIIFQFSISNQSKNVLAPPVKKLICSILVSIENIGESKGLCTILQSIKSKPPINKI